MKVMVINRETGKFEPYEKEVHLKKIEKTCLFSGYDIILAGCSMTVHTSVTKAGQREGLIPWDIKPDGVSTMLYGEIENWSSMGYGIETPEELRTVILKALEIES